MNKPIKLLSFYEFIFDRQQIWYNKEHLKKPYPWTTDPILKTYKFCNVYRELDKGTIYLLDTIINRKDLAAGHKILNCMLYRRFNLPGFFEWIGGPIVCKDKFPFEKILKALEKRKAAGHNLFNDAYIVSQTPYDRKIGMKGKHAQQLCVFRDLVNNTNLWDIKNMIMMSDSIGSIHGLIKKEIFGMGNFLAYQTCTDLTYFPELKGKFQDLNTFVAMGPGSKPGVTLLYPTDQKRHEEDYAHLCRRLWRTQETFFNELKRKTGKDWLKVRYTKAHDKSDYLSLSNIQNCLCEFRKYVTLKTVPGKRKRYYKPAK